jgi:hypothetical protein
MERALEQFVRHRAGNSCEYCRMPQEYDDGAFEIDHVIAASHGGLTVASNLCLACFACNSFKGPNLAGVDSETTKKQMASAFPLERPTSCRANAGGARYHRDIANQPRSSRCLSAGTHRRRRVPAIVVTKRKYNKSSSLSAKRCLYNHGPQCPSGSDILH